jgi:hypothetical protein
VVRRAKGLLASLAVVLVAAGTGPAPASPGGVGDASARRPSRVAVFPQDVAPLTGSGLLATSRFVYYEMLDDAGNTTIGRISPSGATRTSSVSASGYINAAPILAADGGVWFAADVAGGGGLRDTPNLSLAGLNPAASNVKVVPTTGFTLDGWQSAADRDGRFWAQGNTPGVGIVAVGAGLRRPLVEVQTQIGPVSSGSDITLNNPMIRGPGGWIWLLGGDSFSSGLRVTSVGPRGIRVDVAPAGFQVGALALTRARGKVWTVGADSAARLTAFGFDQAGTTKIPTTLRAECRVDAVQPVAGQGSLWFTGTNAGCTPKSRLEVAEVDMSHSTVQTHHTRLRAFRRQVSTVVRSKDAVIVAGRRSVHRLAFARIGNHTRVFATKLHPWVARSQDRYPVVSDRHHGAWAQAVDGRHHLTVVHVTRRGLRLTPTGLTPIAREISVGPDGNLWTQGTQGGHLVLARVTPRGHLTTFSTALSPTPTVLNGVSDNHGHLWFRAQDPKTGDLVLLRVVVTCHRRCLPPQPTVGGAGAGANRQRP